MSQPGATEQGQLLIDIATYVNELTRPIRHKAAYDTYSKTGHRRMTRQHHTVQPSLLDQLRRDMVSSPTPEDDCMIRRAHGSRPPLNSDALDCLLQITAWSSVWVSHGLGLKRRPTVEGNLRALVGAAGGMEQPKLGLMVADVRAWHTAARTVTDWQAPAWRPDAPCPVCEKRNGLRIRLDTHTGLCVLCSSHWTPETIGVLADHVKQSGERAPAVAV